MWTPTIIKILVNDSFSGLSRIPMVIDLRHRYIVDILSITFPIIRTIPPNRLNWG
jgi:hypothetical protein